MAGFLQPRLLRVGSVAPDFELPDQNGKPVRFYERLTHRWGVLFFYPKDDSPLCTRQVCAFRNEFTEFREIGAEVIGISSDSAASHRRFAERHGLPFVLLSDGHGRVQAQYGISKTFGLLPGRVTFVIDPQRTIRMAYSSQLNASAHIEKALTLPKQETQTGKPENTVRI